MEADERPPRALLDELTSAAPLDPALASVLDALPDGILVADLDGRIRQVSGPLEELSGYQAEELVGHHVEKLIPTELRAGHVDLRQGFSADPKGRSMGAGMAIDLRHRDGEHIPVDISLSPVEVSGEAFVVAAVRHAGDRREAEDLLRQALERETEAAETLRRLDRMKDSFLRAVSHDLRSPMATLLGGAMTLRDRYDHLTPEQVRQLLDGVLRGGQRLQGLLTDLLDLDRMNRDAVAVDRSTVDVAALVRAQVEDLDEGRGRVELDVPDELEWLVDPSQLGRIVDNLVTNAWKHAPSDEPVRVRLSQDGEELILAVDDRGPGVPPELQADVFEPFVRGPSDAPGTGVGLSLVAEFARLHGGRAWVEDRPGGGASFRVSFPPVQRLPDEVEAGSAGAGRDLHA